MFWKLLALSAAAWTAGAGAQVSVHIRAPAPPVPHVEVIAPPAPHVQIVQVAPPAPRVEIVPAPRRDYVWVPGAWDWDGRRYVWRTGHHERMRAGHHWREDRWEQHNGGWVRVRGGWERGEPEHHHDEHGHGHAYGHDRGHGPHGHDRDHDGVPDRYDDHPNNPHRR